MSNFGTLGLRRSTPKLVETRVFSARTRFRINAQLRQIRDEELTEEEVTWLDTPIPRRYKPRLCPELLDALFFRDS